MKKNRYNLWKLGSLFLFLFIYHDILADLSYIKLPPGFHIEVYADSVPGARFMTLGDQNIVYVGSIQDKVYALLPNQSGSKAQVITIAKNLDAPNGVAYYKGDLYVALTDRVLSYRGITQKLNNPPKPIVINNRLPTKTWHGYRVIRFSPDGWLYVSIGMPCNICNFRKKNDLFGTLVRMRPDGSQMEIYAKGIRNSMGFDWHPQTHQLWFTDNGQDLMGDNLPPDEINYAPEINMDFGFPYVYGNNIPEPQLELTKMDRNRFIPPVFELPAHVAPLGLQFYTGEMFPAEYRDQIFIAEHGSWNRSKKIGYQVIIARVKNNKVTQVTSFANGWLQNETTIGRPVDLLVMPDGALLVSDDFNNRIYRITYR